MQQRPEPQRPAACQLVCERLLEQRRTAPADHRRPLPDRAPARSSPPAPRSCGRRRRGGGSGSAMTRQCESSGSTTRSHRSRPSVQPVDAPPDAISCLSSANTRSAAHALSPSALAAQARSSRARCRNRARTRAARAASVRSGSCSNAAGPTRSRRARRSATPPHGSISSPRHPERRAIALTVTSRRRRSGSIVSPSAASDRPASCGRARPRATRRTRPTARTRRRPAPRATARAGVPLPPRRPRVVIRGRPPSSSSRRRRRPPAMLGRRRR